jgi:thymidylate kinase
MNLFIPRPDRVVILTCDPEALRRRKPELPLAELEAQLQRLRLLGTRLENVCWIDTNQPIENSRQELLDVVLDVVGHGIEERQEGAGAVRC